MSVSAEGYTNQKMASLGAHVKALQAVLEKEPMKFNEQVASLAAVVDCAVQLTRQVLIARVMQAQGPLHCRWRHHPTLGCGPASLI